MKSVPWIAIEEWAKEYDDSLAHKDFVGKSIAVLHEDGSTYHIRNAIIVSRGNYIVAFVEHGQTLIWSANDLFYYKQYQETDHTQA